MKCVLGFDGGGTKTECVAMDLAANVVARARGPASNPTRVGFESAAAGVKQVAEATIAAAKESVEIAALCAGLAGTARPESHARMKQLLEEQFPGVAIDLRTDLDLPMAAMPEGPAIVLVVGTGSAAVGRDRAGRQLREGGYGPRGSDEGSAFDIGRAAVAAARKASNDEESALSRQILRHLGCSNWQEVDARSSGNADEVFPRVFPVVAASADAGNSLAQSLLNSAAMKLAHITSRLAHSLGIASEPFPLAKTGGTIGRSQFFDLALDRALAAMLPRAVLRPLLVDPAETAARLALRNIAGKEGAGPR
jgi:N-acetylglucosamine kinase-like BadF-type ATPase